MYLANHARVALRGCPFLAPQKEQSMTMLPIDPRQRRPGFPFQDDFFTLGAPVGPDQPNRREDVIRVETILGNTGHHDLSRTDGPVGYWGQRQEQAVKDWQSQNGLTVDGLLKPGGPTITSLKQAAGGLLGGFTPPSPDEVDQHQSQRMQGEPGILNTRPARLSFPRPAQPLELDEQSQAFNADSARALTRSSVNGDIPRIYGDFAKQAGADAHATLMDLAEQMEAQVGRDRTDQVMHGIVNQLPPDQAKALLGGTMPAVRPLGVRSADLPDDSAVPLFRAAASISHAGTEKSSAQTGMTETQKSESGGNVLSLPIPSTVTPGPIPPMTPEEAKATGGSEPKLSLPMPPPLKSGEGKPLPSDVKPAEPISPSPATQQKPNDTQKSASNQADKGRFDRFATGTFNIEGGYSNDPNDTGGETNHGITKGTLDAYHKKYGGLGESGRSVSVKDLTQDQAQIIYKKEYYDDRRIGEIGDEKTAAHVFDLGVNHSPGAGGKMIQKAVNAVIPDAKLEVDGVVGDKTISAINKATPEQLKAINNAIANEREAYYRFLVERDPRQARFLNGWLKRAGEFRQ